MFSYFGAKHASARYYSEPTHDTIVEPFAGAAGYSCYWLERNPTKVAILVESDENVVNEWNRILAATPDEIDSWPNPKFGERTKELTVALIGGGSALPTWPNDRQVTSRMVRDYPSIRQRISRLRRTVGDRITVVHDDYRNAPDIEATWFIDPPYQHRGHQGYRHNSLGIDYKALGEWSLGRDGQVIVCEVAPANWLPFKNLYEHKSLTNKKYTELVCEFNT